MRSLVSSLAVGLLATISAADLVDPAVPDWRGEAGSLSYQWDSFTAAFAEPNFPTFPPFDFSAQVFNFVGGASIEDGSIFSPGGLNLHVYGEGRPTGDIVLNVTYVSFDPTPTSVEAFIGGFGPGASGEYFDAVSSERTFSSFLGDGRFRVNDAFTFDVAAYTGTDEFWASFFKIDGPTTLEGVSIDLRNVVPTPGALAMLGIAGLASRRRRG